MLNFKVSLIKGQSPKDQILMINFRFNFDGQGRVTQASVKNFQLEICDLTEELENRSKEDFIESYLQQTDERSPTLSSSNRTKGTFIANDFISMQFGRISNKEFVCLLCFSFTFARFMPLINFLSSTKLSGSHAMFPGHFHFCKRSRLHSLRSTQNWLVSEYALE